MCFGLLEALLKGHVLGHFDGLIYDVVVLLANVELPIFQLLR
jgi:hypothetical protein